MATLRSLGRAAAVAQVDTLTAGGTIETDDLFKSTIGSKTLSVTGGSATAATVATTFAAAWNASTLLEFAEATAAATSGGALTLTGDTAGVPFTETASTTEANGGAADAQTFSKSATTACTGPNFFDNATNYDGGTVPTTADSLYVDNTDIPILYGLTTQAAETLAGMYIGSNVGRNFRIGLPKYNPAGYPEYRSEYLTIGITELIIGLGTGNGIGGCKINLGSVQSAITILNTGSSVENGLESVLLLGTHASNTLEIQAGNAAVAGYGGEVSTLLTVRNSGGTLRLGKGCTLTTVNQSAGFTSLASNLTTLTMAGGTVQIDLSATLTTGTINGGTLKYNSSGTITTLTINGSGVLDLSGDISPVTVTNITLNGNGRIIDPFKRLTTTNGVLIGTQSRGLQSVAV